MNNWQINYMTELKKASLLQDVLDIAQHAIRSLGLEYSSWIAYNPFPLSRRDMFALTTTDDECHRRLKAGEFNDSPIFRALEETQQPICWQGDENDQLLGQQPEFLSDYRSLGRRSGWAQTTIDNTGTRSFFLNCCTRILSLADLTNISINMQWLAASVHYNMLRVKDRAGVNLSLREREILCWTGDGKTVSDIAEILGLSESTVNFHFRNIMNKLGTPNKTSAVVKAIFLDLLF